MILDDVMCQVTSKLEEKQAIMGKEWIPHLKQFRKEVIRSLFLLCSCLYPCSTWWTKPKVNAGSEECPNDSVIMYFKTWETKGNKTFIPPNHRKTLRDLTRDCFV